MYWWKLSIVSRTPGGGGLRKRVVVSGEEPTFEEAVDRVTTVAQKYQRLQKPWPMWLEVGDQMKKEKEPTKRR